MLKYKIVPLLLLFLYLTAFQDAPQKTTTPTTETIAFRQNTFDIYRVDLAHDNLCLYWKNEDGENLRSLKNLKEHVEGLGENLLFATNAGMYLQDRSPQGLYVENGKVLKSLNFLKSLKTKPTPNFYLMPNGVFYITDNNVPKVVETSEFKKTKDSVQWATQSGPLLLHNNKIHSKFVDGSKNKHIRSGVGILNDHELIFAISNERVSFYDFALFYQKVLGCKDALYLDGAISRMYIEESGRLDGGGDFGVMIGVTEQVTRGE